MKLSLACLAAAAAMVVACANNPPLDFVGEPAPSSSTPIPGPPAPDDAGAADAADADAGKVEHGTCGNGKVTPDEECDDGNNASGDGCSATCKRESSGPDDACPGLTIALTGTGADTRKGTVSATTAKMYGQYAGSCGGGTGQDAVYVVTPDVTGLLTAKLTSTFDSLLYARRTCNDPKTESACNDAPGLNGGDTVTMVVTKAVPVYLFVDGYSGAAGPFTLDVQVTTSFCGNGTAEAPEVCDDGNNVAGDGCAADCTLEAGGDITDCPGQPVTLAGTGNAPRKVSFAGTTATLPVSTLNGTSCGSAGKNAVYAITSDIDGSMTARLVAAYPNASLFVRSECDTATSDTQLDCRETATPLQPLELVVPVRAGHPQYVVVDSWNSSASGPYTLDVVVRPGICGNDVLEGGEDCDDGNTVGGDGCSASCAVEPIPASIDTCPGFALPLTAGAGGSYTGVITSSTATLKSDYKPKADVGGCSSFNAGFAKDAVVAVTSPIDGLLKATVSGTFDTMIYARTWCGPDATVGSDLGCQGAVNGNGPETIAVPISANTPVYLVVDGEITTGAGVFELGVVVTPRACGNGTIEGGEKCDDGNTTAGDGCSATCDLEPATSHDTCGNAEAITLSPGAGGTFTATVASGTTNLANDQTFTGCASDGPDAIYKIVAPISGLLRADVPAAGFNVSLGARSTCPSSTTASLPIVCANASSAGGLEEISLSVVQGQTYYLIVDGTAATEKGAFTMLVNVSPPGCGDGLVAGAEQCDDGNGVDGDGCSATCMFEPTAGIDTCPGYALTLSGMGNEPRVGVRTVNTSPLAANYGGSCGGNSKEGVVVVTPPISGTLTAKLTGIDYQPVLYVRSSCTEPTTQLACASDAPTPSSFSRNVTFTVLAGTPYYLFIDGYNGGAGTARLNVTVTP